MHLTEGEISRTKWHLKCLTCRDFDFISLSSNDDCLHQIDIPWGKNMAILTTNICYK